MGGTGGRVGRGGGSVLARPAALAQGWRRLMQVTNGESGKEGDFETSWPPDGESLAVGCAYSVPASVLVVMVMLRLHRRRSSDEGQASLARMPHQLQKH